MRASHPLASRRGLQAGLTLVEFMVSIVLGMIVVAAIALLIANQSTNRAEVDRAGRMIENGRYAIQTIVDDVQMAGYWGELTSTPGVSGPGLPNPCSALLADVQNGMGLHVQGYDDSTLTSGTLSGCVTNWKSGTDIIVVRHADADYSDVLNGSGAVDLSKLSDGQIYLQTGLTSATGTAFNSVVAAGNSAQNTTNFSLVKKDGSVAPPRKILVHVYYVATCDVCGTDTIPTLKRAELGVASNAATMSTVTIAEGVENLQIDYGLDSDADGAPDGTDVNAASTTLGNVAANWQNAMSARIYLIARSTDPSPQFTDAKTYAMGTSTYTPPTSAQGYERHLFTQLVRMANPSLRRSS